MDESEVRTVFGPIYGMSTYRNMALIGLVMFVVAALAAQVVEGTARVLLTVIGMFSAFAALAGAIGRRRPYQVVFDVDGFEVRPQNRFRSVHIPWNDVAAWDIRPWGGPIPGDVLLAWPADHVRDPAKGPAGALWSHRANAWVACDLGQCDGTEEETARAIGSVAPHLPRRAHGDQDTSD